MPLSTFSIIHFFGQCQEFNFLIFSLNFSVRHENKQSTKCFDINNNNNKNTIISIFFCDKIEKKNIALTLHTINNIPFI